VPCTMLDFEKPVPTVARDRIVKVRCGERANSRCAYGTSMLGLG
jgi:hypothetical protein